MNYYLFLLFTFPISYLLTQFILHFPDRPLLSTIGSCAKCYHRQSWWQPLIFWRRCAKCHQFPPSWIGGVIILHNYLLLLVSTGQITRGCYLFLLLSLVLACYDCLFQEYPLIIWLVFFLLLLCYYPTNLLSIIFILIAILAVIFPIPIGSGDFFYLAAMALYLQWSQVLLVLQLSSLIGIIYCLLFKKQQMTIAFIPFLSLAFLLVLFFIPY